MRGREVAHLGFSTHMSSTFMFSVRTRHPFLTCFSSDPMPSSVVYGPHHVFVTTPTASSSPPASGSSFSPELGLRVQGLGMSVEFLGFWV